jgi:hypothetical protein
MIKISKKSFLVVFIIALVAAAGGAAFMYLNSHNDKKTYAFIIDNQKYTKTDIKKLVAYVNQISPKTDNVKIAFEAYENQAAAKKLGITVPQKFIDNEKESLSKLYGKYPGSPNNSWVELIAYDNGLKQFLDSDLTSGTPQGYSFVFWANQHVAAYYITGTPPDGTGNQAVIDADKAYALSKANYYHDQILNKKITHDNALAEIKADLKLNQGLSSNANFSVKFGYSSSKSWLSEVYVPNIQQYISSLSSVGISGVQTAELVSGKVDYGTFYFFTDVSQLGSKSITSADLNNQIKKMKVNYYGL